MSYEMVAGIYYRSEDFDRYAIEVPEVTELRKYDPVTGRKLKKNDQQLITLQQATKRYKFRKVEGVTLFDFVHELSEYFECGFSYDLNGNAVFHPTMCDGDFLSIRDLCKSKKKIAELKKRIEKTGFIESIFEFHAVHLMNVW